MIMIMSIIRIVMAKIMMGCQLASNGENDNDGNILV